MWNPGIDNTQKVKSNMRGMLHCIFAVVQFLITTETDYQQMNA